MPASDPAYLELFESGELARQPERAVESLSDCAMCARECRVDRLDKADLKSYCRT